MNPVSQSYQSHLICPHVNTLGPMSELELPLPEYLHVIDERVQACSTNSSCLGVVRGITVHSIIYPLEVVKLNQQTKYPGQTSFQVAKTLWQKEGPLVFHRGIQPQLVKTSLKQAWCWPMITGVPRFLDRYPTIKPLQQQLITGLGIATIDALVTTPLERAKFRAVFNKQTTFSINNIYKTGWHGLGAHWAKLSVNWSAFLVAQKYFRGQACEKTGQQQLSLPQLMCIGTKVAFVVGAFAAPFDMRHALTQVEDVKPSSMFKGKILRNMYRGCPINIFSLIIHNIASIILIDRLEYLGNRKKYGLKKGNQ